MRLRREGARDAYIQLLKEEEELTDEDVAADDVQQEINEYVESFSTPGESTSVPEIGPSTPESIERGKAVYAKFACVSCHGETGRGDGVQSMYDDEKLPTRPRDFTLGIFKGEHDPESLYRRIAYGMPGTPMPSSSGMTPDEMVSLVHYILSMSTEEARQSAILSRQSLAARRVDAIPAAESDEDWQGIPSVAARLMPLWWRNDATSDVAVQAAHDGETIAIRLSWSDDTPDWEAVHSDTFEDAVAMQLHHGKREPFLGMGDPSSPVDAWFWDADRQRGLTNIEQLAPNGVVDVFPFNESAVESASMSRPGAQIANQPDISLPAVRSGNQITPTDGMSGGSSLQAGGPGSVTFRIPKSQFVDAHGDWQDGRWTVVIKRPLKVPSPEDGISLEPGQSLSVAFAVWDGSHKDRNGQKSITIWHDVTLDK